MLRGDKNSKCTWFCMLDNIHGFHETCVKILNKGKLCANGICGNAWSHL